MKKTTLKYANDYYFRLVWSNLQHWPPSQKKSAGCILYPNYHHNVCRRRGNLLLFAGLVKLVTLSPIPERKAGGMFHPKHNNDVCRRRGVEASCGAWQAVACWSMKVPCLLRSQASPGCPRPKALCWTSQTLPPSLASPFLWCWRNQMSGAAPHKPGGLHRLIHRL